MIFILMYNVAFKKLLSSDNTPIIVKEYISRTHKLIDEGQWSSIDSLFESYISEMTNKGLGSKDVSLLVLSYALFEDVAKGNEIQLSVMKRLANELKLNIDELAIKLLQHSNKPFKKAREILTKEKDSHKAEQEIYDVLKTAVE